MKTLDQHIATLNDKNVLVRCNFDVPIEKGKVQDTTRIEDALATIRTLQKQHNRIIVLAHLGRPDGAYSQEFSLKPVVSTLTTLLNQPVGFAEYNKDITQSIKKAAQLAENIVVLDNLRFWPGEEANEQIFAQTLAQAGQAYVNESFATCHRAHASMVGVATLLDSYAGLSLAREIKTLTRVKKQPEHPFVVVIGGAKLETKEPLVTSFVSSADTILVGGKIAHEMRQHPEPLPDNVILAELEEHGKDITSQSAQDFAQIITTAKMVVWNGAMGVFEEKAYQEGTRIVGQALNDTKAFTVVGGGDTEAALTEFDLEAGIDHISTGGGAMLEYLTQSSLPGIEALG